MRTGSCRRDQAGFAPGDERAFAAIFADFMDVSTAIVARSYARQPPRSSQEVRSERTQLVDAQARIVLIAAARGSDDCNTIVDSPIVLSR